MIWLVVCIMSLTSASSSEGNDSPGAPKLWFSALKEIKKAVEATRMEPRGNEFVLVLLRLMGIDSGKVKDLALDGIVTLVHLMGQTLLKDGEKDRVARRASRDFSLFHFILRQPQVTDLLEQMQDPSLVDSLLKESTDKLKNSDEDVECVRLLICKTNPIVRGMQRSLRFFMKREGIRAPGYEGEACPNEGEEEFCLGGDEDVSWEKASLEDRMFFFLPGLGEIVIQGDRCDQLFPNCEY